MVLLNVKGGPPPARSRAAVVGVIAVILFAGFNARRPAPAPKPAPRPFAPTALVVRPLDAAERALYQAGESLFDMCTACHGERGEGVPGQTPPLVGSHIALGPIGRSARILLHGMDGPLTVSGVEYNNAMPPPLLESDEEVAAVLTYIRRAWGNEATAVSPATIAAIRAATGARTTPWTWAELEQVP